MRYIYRMIITYKMIHPIRFWFIILFFTALFFILIELYYRWILKKEKKSKKEPVNEPVNESTNESTNESANESAEMHGHASQLEEDKHPRNNKRKILLFTFMFIVFFIIFRIQTSFRDNNNETRYIKKSNYTFGIDVSQYQGKINWKELKTSHHPIKYIFIRATMGIDGKDTQFDRNWTNAKKYKYVRGAYHYYRPSENSTKQFKNFASTVKLQKGDFIPILDIEKPSRYGSSNLRRGVLNWLRLAEKKYGVRPMIYTGRTFYKVNLQGYVNNYPLWIASYSHKKRVKNLDWTFHQFTEKVRVNGIRDTVDGNDFKGKINDLKKMCIK